MKDNYFSAVTKQYIYVIEHDGDKNKSFYESVKILETLETVLKIKYHPGFFDSAYYHFIFKNSKLFLEYSGFNGTEVKTEPNPKEESISNACEIANILIDQLSKNHS